MIRRHLDNAATSHPKPEAVARAVASALEMPGSPGRGSGAAARSADSSLAAARAAVAGFLGAPPERLAFTLNATDALNLAVASLARPGARVVVSALEHSAVLRPLRRREREGSLRLVRVDPGRDGTLDPRTVAEAARGAALVAVTLASNVTGRRQPVEEIAAALPRDPVLLVDAAQGAGSLPLEASALGPRAVTCGTGHKALLGPMGCGFVIAGEDVTLAPSREGGTGDGADDQPEELPGALESGTPPLPAILGLAAGVGWWETEGVDAVRGLERARMERIVAALREARAELPGFTAGERAPLACFRLPDLSVQETADLLDAEHGITVRAGLHCAPSAHRFLGTWPDGLVRVSVGPTTTDEDVEAFCEAMRELSE